MTASEARAEFLRRLANDDLVPTEVDVATTARVVCVDLPHGSHSDHESVAKAVESFAVEFWSLSIEERHSRWNALQMPGILPSVASRLRKLQRGLDISNTPHPDPAVERIATAIREGFILSPRARAVARARLLEQQSPELISAANRLRTDFPELAALDPLGVQLWAGETPDVPSLTGQPNLYAEAAWLKRPVWDSDRPKRPPLEVEPEPKQVLDLNYDQGSMSGWGIWMVIFVILMIARAVSYTLSGSSTPSTPPSNNNSPPSKYYAPPSRATKPPSQFKDPLLMDITPEELIAISLYDPKSGKVPPPKYALSRLAGITDNDLKIIREKHLQSLEAAKKIKQIKDEIEAKHKTDNNAPQPKDKR